MRRLRQTIGVFILVASASATARTSAFKIADGKTVQVPEKGFSLIPPKLWEYRTDLPNLSLFAQAPKEKGNKYQRTIQVMVRNAPLSIDETTATQVEEELVKVFGQGASGVVNFHVRNHEIVELTNHSKGILYYTGLTLDGIELMQIHVLTSSDSRHYISTFTDLAEHFDKGSDSPVLMTAWEALSSIEVQGSAPKRFQTPITVFAIIGSFVLLGFAIMTIRSISSAKQYRKLEIQADREAKMGEGRRTSRTSSRSHSGDGQRKRQPSHASFQGSSEVTKASAHMASLPQESDEDDFDDDQWNLTGTKNNGQAS